MAATRLRATDPQIAAIVVTANQVDIDAGKLAKAELTRYGRAPLTPAASTSQYNPLSVGAEGG